METKGPERSLPIRERLVEALEADLIGPFLPDDRADAREGQEVLPHSPSRWYLTGFLAPRGHEQPEVEDAESHDEELGAGSDGTTEEGAADNDRSKRRPRFPSSMGLSVFLPPGDANDTIEVEVRYAYYDRVDVTFDQDGRVATGYQRVPCGPTRVSVPLDNAILQGAVGVVVPNRGARSPALDAQGGA